MSIRKKLSLVRNLLIFAVIAWFLVTFMIVPVISIFKETFFTEGQFSFETVQKLIDSPRVKKALANTFSVRFWTVITVTIVGMLQIILTEHFDIRGSKLMNFAFMTPLVYGGIALVSGYNYVYGLRSYDLSSLLSLILAVVCIVLLLFMRWLEKKSNYISASKVPTKMRKIKVHNPVVNVLMHIIGYALVVLYLLPIVSIVLFSLGHYIRVFSNSATLRPFLNNVKLSLLAVVFVLLIAIASSLAIHKKPGKATTLLEMTLLVVGMITTFSTPNILVFGKVLLGEFWLLPIAYTVSKIPSSMRLIRASLFTINNSHEEASRSLGAGAFYTFRRVLLPVIMPMAVSVGAITFNGLLSEYTISALLYNINNTTPGIALRNPDWNTDPNGPANSLVYIIVLMIISGITLAATQEYRNQD